MCKAIISDPPSPQQQVWVSLWKSLCKLIASHITRKLKTDRNLNEIQLNTSISIITIKLSIFIRINTVTLNKYSQTLILFWESVAKCQRFMKGYHAIVQLFVLALINIINTSPGEMIGEGNDNFHVSTWLIDGLNVEHHTRREESSG